MNRKLEPEVHAHFQPAPGDLVYIKLNNPANRTPYMDNLTQTSTVYGDNDYAKLSCEFKPPRGSSAAYATWRGQITLYIIACSRYPGRLTESLVDSIIAFARGLSPVRERIELFKCQYHADDVWELIRHLDPGPRFGQETKYVQRGSKG